MKSKERQLEHVLHNEIPLTQTIGIRVIEFTGTKLTLSAPLENNVNHKNTAFGGSLYSVAVLAGWCFLYLRLNALNLHGHIVIQESHMQYLYPVTEDIVATCAIESTDSLDHFVKTFIRKKRARISLTSHIELKDLTAAILTGSYVVHN